MRAWVLACVAFWSCGDAPEEAARTERCASCHVSAAREWSASRHGQSGNSPVFIALLPHVERAWGANARARCVACHTPGFVNEPAIGCASCHLAVGNRGTFNGAVVVKLDAPIAVRTVPANAPHATSARGFLTSASLCGTCHEVRGPAHLDEPTLSEYRAADTRGEDECVSCHFEEGHRFSGLEPRWGGTTAEVEEGTRSAQRLLQRALSLEVAGTTVRLTNVGATHGVPTGMTAMRDVWVDVTVRDAQGALVKFPRVIELGARLEGSALFTDATAIVPRSLAAGQRREWQAPGVVVEASLHARAYRDEALEALGLGSMAAQVPEILVTTQW